MAVKIDLHNSKISGDTRVLNNTVIKGTDSVELDLHSSEISEQAKVLENLEINSVLSLLEDKIPFMEQNSVEYAKLQELIKKKDWKKNVFITCITKHLSEFSQGVLASVIANLLT
jgi:hypothetical protein